MKKMVAVHPVPKTNDELVLNFGALVACEIHKKNTVCDNFPDIYQEVMLYLFRNDVIASFHRSVEAVGAEPTPFRFLNYLGTAVRNGFANFCRHRYRKWQDRPADVVGKKKDPKVSFYDQEGHYDLHWEATIEDPEATEDIEQGAEQALLWKQVEPHVPEQHQVSLCDLMQQGYTLLEAVQQTDMRPARKRVLQRLFG